MSFASEEVTKSWKKKKNIIIRSRPSRSNFSFAVCLSLIATLIGGFLGGFVTAGFALGENYGAVYEGLITELEATRQCIERERNELKSLREAHLARADIDAALGLTTAQAPNAINNAIIYNKLHANGLYNQKESDKEK